MKNNQSSIKTLVRETFPLAIILVFLMYIFSHWKDIFEYLNIHYTIDDAFMEKISFFICSFLIIFLMWKDFNRIDEYVL